MNQTFWVYSESATHSEVGQMFFQLNQSLVTFQFPES